MKSELTHPIFACVQRESERLEQQSYVVGGYVRDALLGRESKDVDFVTLGSGIALATAVHKQLGEGHLSLFKNFGTAQIKTEEWEFEFVGARKESYRKDSRKPAVEDGSFSQDIDRRDFTINAMAIDLSSAKWGQLIDLYDGQKDLANRIIKTPLDPTTTFDDDPLRMMRAARFASQLGFEIEPQTYAAMKEQAKRLEIVSQERITDELQKIMMSPKPSVGFKILFSTGLLQVFFPDLAAMQGVELRNGHAHKDNFYHTLEVLDKTAAKSENIWLRWAALMHDIAKPPTKRYVEGEGWTFHGHEDKGSRMVVGIFKRLKLPLNDKMKYVAKLVRLHLRPIALTKEEISDSAVRRLIFEAGDDLEDLMTLCTCDITTKNKEKEKKFQANLARVQARIEEVEQRDKIRNWQPPIDGNQIMSIFGIGAGKEIGLIKAALKDAILDGDISNNYEEALRFVLETGISMGLSKKKDE